MATDNSNIIVINSKGVLGGISKNTFVWGLGTSQGSAKIEDYVLDFQYGPDGDFLSAGDLTFDYGYQKTSVIDYYNSDGSSRTEVKDYYITGPGETSPALFKQNWYEYTTTDWGKYGGTYWGTVTEISYTAAVHLDSRLAVEENLEYYSPTYAYVGSSLSDIWVGTDLAERVKTLNGHDSVAGGGGDDTLQGGAGNDTLKGGDGSDVLWGYEDDDLLDGGSGIDDVFGNTGNDTLFGGDGNDRIDGGAGDDRLEGQLGNDLLIGGDGNDTIYSIDTDYIDGGYGIDQVYMDRSNLSYGLNASFYQIYEPNSPIALSDGTKLVGVEKLSLTTGSGNDQILVGIYNQLELILNTGAGNDTIIGTSGADLIYGGDGNDSITCDDTASVGMGQQGNAGDTIYGGAGDDYVYTVEGGDATVDGGDGNDTLRLFSLGGSYDFSGSGDLISNGLTIRNFENYYFRISVGGANVKFGSGNDIFNSTDVYKFGSGSYSTAYGGSGNDTFLAAGYENTFFGEDGNDTFSGGDYSNKYSGGNGNDIFYTCRDHDLLVGGAGEDTFYGSITLDSQGYGYYDENDIYHADYATIDGGGDTDKLILYNPYGSIDLSRVSFTISSDRYGLNVRNIEVYDYTSGNGSDSIVGGSGNDTLRGGVGDDTILSGNGDDRVEGGAGADRLEGQLGNDLLIGGDGNDVLTGLEGQDTMQGGAGNDQLYSYVGQGFDAIDGGADIDFAFISRTNLTTNLTLDLSLAGTQDLGDGTLVTSIEQLTYKGGFGEDRIGGGALADDLTGNAGNDSLVGQGGNDTLDGGAGTDTLLGGAGDDTIVVRGGEALSDLIDASTGTDTLKVDGTAALMLSGFNSLVNGIEGWSGNGKAVAGTGAAERFDLSNLTSITGLLSLDAAGGNDTVIGSLVADDLRGGAGADSLSGGAGDDTLTGGAGNDTLDGGAGSDIIVFSGLRSNYSVASRTSGGYVVTDLSTGSPDGVDVVLNAEVLRFSDTSVTLSTSNRAPGAISDSNAAANLVTENADTGTLVGVTALASDPDAGDRLTYTLINNAGGRFTINANTGLVTVANGTLLDYETATGHLIRVRATDTGGLFSEADFTVNLTDVAEGGTSYTGTAASDTFTATSSANWTLSGLDGNDSLTGAGGNDTLDGGLGTDTLTGGAGNDIFLVRGTEASADVMQGGDGTADTLRVDGTAALTLAGFDTSLNGIEVWAGNNKGVIGTGAANRFDLSSLTSITGLPSLDAGGGNDTVIGSGAADNLLGGAGLDSLFGGAGNDTLTGGTGNDTLDGGAGADTIVFSGLLSNYSVANRTGGGYLVQDLRTGSPDGTDVVLNAEVLRFSDASVTLAASNSAPTGIALSGTQVSENAAAGTLIGTLTGTDPDAGDKLTFALAAPSGLFAMSGTSLVVASGAVLDYEAAQSQSVLIKVTDAAGASYTESFSVSLTNQFVTMAGSAAAEALSAPIPGEEARVLGLDGNDTLTGTAGNDTLDGGNGADLLVGGAGADQLIGGAGSDTADYGSATAGIGLDMADAAWAGAYGDARGDGLTGIERVNGSAYADVIRGSSAADVLSGNAGNDLLLGQDGADILTGGDGNDTIEGGVGADNLNGQGGTDLISYASATGGITLDLANLISRTGEAALDTIQGGFEGIIGTAFADTLSGTTGSNVLEGGAGNDVLSGRAGADTFVFRSGSGSDLITDFTAGAGVNDVIEWHGQFTALAQVQAAASDYTGTVQGAAFTGVKIVSGADELYLSGVTKAALVADDFAYL